MAEKGFLSDFSSQTLSSFEEEPIITDEIVPELEMSESAGEVQESLNLDPSNADQKTVLQCRSARIGSYRVVPKVKVTFTPLGIKFTVPVPRKPDKHVDVEILHHEINEMLIHFGWTMPVLFFFTKPETEARIRKLLHMTDKMGFYYDSMSSDETHRRITFLPEKIDEDSKDQLLNFYQNSENLEFTELDHAKANEILMKASPKYMVDTIQNDDSKKHCTKMAGKKKQKIKQKQIPQRQKPCQKTKGPNVKIIMVYPPPPEMGGIQITTRDYSCLQRGRFLNDVIIEMYLKYFVEKTLTPGDRYRTHVFNTYFYSTLVREPITKSDETSLAFQRHSRVKRWTKKVDIFTKDYIIIPINDNSHWFLAIICFPGLTGPVRFDNDMPIPGKEKKKAEEKPSLSGKHTMKTDLGDEVEDRDEADREDERMDVANEDEDVRVPIKQPCILIFNSLERSSRWQVVVDSLRDYLRLEYEAKHGGTRDFSDEVLKGTNVLCPQQPNTTDCGLYVLQYVEAFFKNPIQDYNIPISSLRDWFPADIVARKRYDIQQLILQLLEEQSIDIDALSLPQLTLL